MPLPTFNIMVSSPSTQSTIPALVEGKHRRYTRTPLHLRSAITITCNIHAWSMQLSSCSSAHTRSCWLENMKKGGGTLHTHAHLWVGVILRRSASYRLGVMITSANADNCAFATLSGVNVTVGCEMVRSRRTRSSTVKVEPSWNRAATSVGLPTKIDTSSLVFTMCTGGSIATPSPCLTRARLRAAPLDVAVHITHMK